MFAFTFTKIVQLGENRFHVRPRRRAFQLSDSTVDASSRKRRKGEFWNACMSCVLDKHLQHVRLQRKQLQRQENHCAQLYLRVYSVRFCPLFYLRCLRFTVVFLSSAANDVILVCFKHAGCHPPPFPQICSHSWLQIASNHRARHNYHKVNMNWVLTSRLRRPK